MFFISLSRDSLSLFLYTLYHSSGNLSIPFKKNKKFFYSHSGKNKRRFCPPFNSFRGSTSNRPNTLHSIECLYNCIHQVATLFFSSGLLLFPSKSPRLLFCRFPQGKSKNLPCLQLFRLLCIQSFFLSLCFTSLFLLGGFPSPHYYCIIVRGICQ